MKQTRNLLLTTHNLANVKEHQFQRRIGLRSITAMTKSTESGNNEFICHVKNEYDYRFTADKREELFDALKECYFNLMNDNLPIYGVPGKVKEFSTSKKDIKAGLEKEPPASYRLRNEDTFEPLKDADPISSALDDDMPNMSSDHRPTFAKKGDMDVSLADFEMKKVIGRGSFGKVFLVQKRGTNEIYAMKSLRKDVIIEYDQVESTKLEKDILMKADHPFLVGMSYVFQTDQKIFFVMRFVRGGELFMHLR